MEVDLHIHTTASDGTYTPAEVVDIAKKNNVKAMAITDHDNIDALLAGKDRADHIGIEFINGIEISCNIGRYEVHILGYFLDLKDKRFIDQIEILKKEREDRNDKILLELRKKGVILEKDVLKDYAPGNIISRAHIANYMLAMKYVGSKQEAFDKYLGNTGVAYVPKADLTPQKAITIIKDNKGIVSLAHPKLITQDDIMLTNLIKDLKKYGLDALECQYSSFNKSEERKYRKLAKKYELEITGGSDFHGENRPGVEIGSSGIYLSQLDLLKKLKGEII